MEKTEILKSRIEEVKSHQVEKGDMILSALHLTQELFENSIPL